MAHQLMRLLCLEFKVVDYDYFMNKLELWEAYLLCNNLQYTDRSLWECSRLIAYVVAQTQSTKKLKPTDIIDFEWHKVEKPTVEKLTKAERKERQAAFEKLINNG